MRRSLKELDLGLKGELTITSDMEDLSNSLFFDQVLFHLNNFPWNINDGLICLLKVPPSWTKRAYASLNGLSAWYADLLLRIKELESWTYDFNLPSSVWLPGFFNPQSFLTAIMQSTARKNELPLDKMCLVCEVTKKNKEEIGAAPREGAYTHGLYMEVGLNLVNLILSFSHNPYSGCKMGYKPWLYCRVSTEGALPIDARGAHTCRNTG